MKKSTLTIGLILSTAFLVSVFAQDAGLSVQGVLRTGEGHAVENGFYRVKFRLYDAPKNGNLIWQETQDSVNVRGGIYSIILGSVNPLTAAFDEKYYLGVSVEHGEELIPRAELTSSPYALSLIGEDNIFPNSGNVGVGDTDPAQKLTVKNGTGRIGIDTETNAGYTTTIIGKEYEVTFDNNGTSKDFSFRQNGNERVRVRHHGLNMKGDGSAYFDIQAANSRALIGFTAANSSIMNIHNIDGETRYTADLNRFYGRVYSYNGLNVLNERSFFYEKVDISRNGGSLALLGTDHSYMEFYPTGTGGGRKAYFGFSAPGNPSLNLANESTNGEIQLITHSGDIVLTPGANRQISMNGYLRLYGKRVESINNYDYLDENGVGFTNNNATTHDFSLYADDKIRAIAFYTASDNRIKKDLKISNRKADLTTLNKIEVTDYRHIDESAHGSNYKKGLIAQQVATVFPEAITYSVDVVPNVFAFPENIQLEKNGATFILSKAHDLKEGDKLKMVTSRGAEFFTVSKINAPKSFSIDDWSGTAVAKEVFVYGKEVEDFHTVDYDRVFTLAVSATQELARKVEALETTLSAVRKENAQLKLEKENTNAALMKLSSQVEKLEQVFNATSSN